MVDVTGESNADEFFKQLNLSKSSCSLKSIQEANRTGSVKQSRRIRSRAASSCKNVDSDGVSTETNSKISRKQITRISQGHDPNHDKDEDTESEPPSSDSEDDMSDDEVIANMNIDTSVSSPAQRKMVKAEIERGTDHTVLRGEEALKKKLKSPPYTCIVNCCNDSFESWEKFIRHLRQHRSCYPYSCTKCEAKFRCRIDLMNHLRRHFGLKNVSCEICGMRFEKKRSLVSHMIAKHHHEDERPRNFRCTECGEAFLQKCAVDRHMRFHTGFRPEACKFCNASFHTEYDLKEHIRIHTGEKPFKCDQCNYCARTSQLLKRHKKSHSDNKPFCCDKCNFKCNNRQSLKRHKVKHSGNLPYKCPYCDHRCSDMDNLKKHIRKVKKHKGQKIYPCFSCQFSSDDSSSYLKHLKQYHIPGLDLRTAKATTLSGILVEAPEQNADVTENFESQDTGFSTPESPMKFFNDRCKMTCMLTSENSLYPPRRGDILLSSTALDNCDSAQNEEAFPSGPFSDSTCWIPAICRGASTQNREDMLSPREIGHLQMQECIAIFIEPGANQEIEIHQSDGGCEDLIENTQ